MAHQLKFNGMAFKNVIVRRKKEDAKRVADKYRDKGYNARVVKSKETKRQGGRTWYGVYVPTRAPPYSRM